MGERFMRMAHGTHQGPKASGKRFALVCGHLGEDVRVAVQHVAGQLVDHLAPVIGDRHLGETAVLGIAAAGDETSPFHRNDQPADCALLQIETLAQVTLSEWFPAGELHQRPRLGERGVPERPWLTRLKQPRRSDELLEQAAEPVVGQTVDSVVVIGGLTTPRAGVGHFAFTTFSNVEATAKPATKGSAPRALGWRQLIVEIVLQDEVQVEHGVQPPQGTLQVDHVLGVRSVGCNVVDQPGVQADAPGDLAV